MGVLTPANVGRLVKRMNETYQPTGRCSEVADKPHMHDLVDRLRGYTTQVKAEAARQGIIPDMDLPQWALDLEHWEERLEGYQRALDNASEPRGAASCEEIYAPVVGPLLDGRYEIGTPGIVNPQVQSFPDIATPYMLGNQIVVWREFQARNFMALIDLFIDEAKKLVGHVADAGRRAAPNVLMIGAGIALAAFGVSWAVKEVRKGGRR